MKRPPKAALPRSIAFFEHLALLGATTTGREAAAEDITGVYSAFWAGLPAGQTRVKLQDSGSGYSDEIEISTQGLPRLFTSFRATALAEVRRGADRLAEPSHYLAVYDLWKRRDSRVRMQFFNRTGTMIAERGPDDTPESLPSQRRSARTPWIRYRPSSASASSARLHR
jgi:hypothetical protein